MTCHSCRIECKRNGKHRNGLQRYRCAQCQKTFTEAHERPFDAMYTSADKGLLALKLLLEGSSIRSTERITGLHRDTILRLLVLAGERCEKILGEKIRNVPVKDVQLDEIWGSASRSKRLSGLAKIRILEMPTRSWRLSAIANWF